MTKSMETATRWGLILVFLTTCLLLAHCTTEPVANPAAVQSDTCGYPDIKPPSHPRAE